MREVREETALTIEPVGLAGYREVVARDGKDKVERHFVILCFAARWLAGEVELNEELDDARWLAPDRACRADAPPRAWPRSSRPRVRCSAPDGLPCGCPSAGAYQARTKTRICP